MGEGIQTVTAKLQANRLDRRTLDGRAYAVVPVVAMVAGVRNGELVTAEELGAFVAAWDGRPIPLRHPEDSEGNYITANSPEVIERQVLGSFFNAHMDGAALKGELWLDVAKAGQLGGDALLTLNRLERGEMLEVSIAYFCDFDPIAGEYGGETYTAIQRNLRPDHVALLPDEFGACSVADGCGANRVNRANAGVDFSQSIMVAFYLSPDDAQALALPDGTLPEGSQALPAAELHVTLAYLGKMPDIGAEFNRVAWVLAEEADSRVVVLAEVAGMGRFANAESGLDAVFLLLDSEGLHELRFWLADRLGWDLGLEVARRWGFVPHVTLGYVPSPAEVQLSPVARRPLVFDRLALSWGDQTVVFPLRGETRPPGTSGEDAAVAAANSRSEENMDQQDKKGAKASIKGNCQDAPKANEEGAAEAQVTVVEMPELAAEATLELPSELTELAQAIRDFGGVQPLMDAVLSIKANSDRQKSAAVARLATNARCAFGKADLEAMSLDQLSKLEASLAPRSYVGQNGAMAEPDAGDELRVFKGHEEPAKAAASA